MYCDSPLKIITEDIFFRLLLIRHVYRRLDPLKARQKRKCRFVRNVIKRRILSQYVSWLILSMFLSTIQVRGTIGFRLQCVLKAVSTMSLFRPLPMKLIVFAVVLLVTLGISAFLYLTLNPNIEVKSPEAPPTLLKQSSVKFGPADSLKKIINMARQAWSIIDKK